MLHGAEGDTKPSTAPAPWHQRHLCRIQVVFPEACRKNPAPLLLFHPLRSPASDQATAAPDPGPAELIPDSLGTGPDTSVGFGPRPKIKLPPRNKIDQTHAEADAKSAGCMQCHRTTDAHTMHASPNVVLGCTDCHGGSPKRGLTKDQAHVHPLYPEFWVEGANPLNSTVLLNHESPEFIKFFNPGDLRVCDESCGPCHSDTVERVRHSMMNHGGMLWNAAAYNNGAIQYKNAIVGQAYSQNGAPLMLQNPFPPTAEETTTKGILPWLLPLPRFNRGQPGNVFRIFEKGGSSPLSLGSPTLDEPPGAPERRLSERGLGTLNRTDPLFLGAQKTRLHDPMLHFLGSNDHPGDYRSSGCSSCHVVYANDRSPSQSGWYAKYGNQGLSFSKDPMIPKDQRGHPIFHKFTSAIPTSMCMNCHMHQGNLFVNPYLGYIWWDQETDAKFMYPNPENPLAGNSYFRGKRTPQQMLQQHNPTDDELVRITSDSNPEGAVARGLWGDLDFLERTSELNSKLEHTQFADYHGHGWIYRAIFKQDKKGNRLDREDNVIEHNDFKHAVHLKDIHLERGMQCGDCHFDVDAHGNGLLYGEPRNATTIMCIDCHGTINARPTLITSGSSGATDPKNRRNIKPVNLASLRTAFGPRFEWEGDKLIQYSSMRPDLKWEMPQTIDTINPFHPKYNAKSRYAKTLRRDGTNWGELPEDWKKLPADEVAGKCKAELAHANENFDCQVCHTAWATSCFGCHLNMKANQRVQQNKFEGVVDRNYTTYNPQIVRDDVFQLGLDSTVKGHRLAVLRSSSAVVVSSQNANREYVYNQVQTMSGEGYSGQAFNPHFAHTTSGKGTTKTCTDCHLSTANDNNAWMASLLGFGTGSVNFFGTYAWVGGEDEINAVVWTERDEPQAPIGSSFQKYAYSDNYQKHLNNKRELKEAYEHHSKVVNDLTVRAEYLYTANGEEGLEVYDIANIDQKGFSERFSTSVISPLGQRTYVRSPNATAVAMPSTLANDPYRTHLPPNEEQPMDAYVGYVFVSDLEKGLFVVNIGTLYDGNPENNFLHRAKLKDDEGNVTGEYYNPGGRLDGATFAVCGGHRVYMTTARGLAIVDVKEPERPRLIGELANGFLKNPKCITLQFQYAFITDDDGLKIVNISDPSHPRAVSGGVVRLADAQKLYVARTYAYVANGHEGLAIIDVQNPEHPFLDQMFNAGGELNDTHGVQIGSVAASMYALIADGHNGFRVVQLISPDTVEGASGFSPRPAPRLIATYKTHHPALAISRGLDRDRVVDETGGQTVVFGRRGARPFHVDEMQPFIKHRDGEPYRVEDVLLKKVTEEKEIKIGEGPDAKVEKIKTTRTGIFTKSGTELKDPNPAKPPPPGSTGGATPLAPKLELLDSPFNIPPGTVPPIQPPVKPEAPKPEEEKK
jgi:hypothetical protein